MNELTSTALKDAKTVTASLEAVWAVCGFETLSNRSLPPTAQVRFEEPLYQLPFGEQSVSHSVIFNVEADNPVFLRPADIERLYGIPASTVYDWIHDIAVTRFPVVKLAVKDESKRRLVLVPKRLLDEWLIEHSTLTKELTVKRGKRGLPKDSL